MKCTVNIGREDKLIRIILGTIIVVASFYSGFYYKTWLGVVGFVLLVTSFTGFCFIYKIFGVSTLRGKDFNK